MMYYNVLDIIDLTMKYDDNSSKEEFDSFRKEINKIIKHQKEINYQFDELETALLVNFILKENCFGKSILILYSALASDLNQMKRIVHNRVVDSNQLGVRVLGLLRFYKM